MVRTKVVYHVEIGAAVAVHEKVVLEDEDMMPYVPNTIRFSYDHARNGRIYMLQSYFAIRCYVTRSVLLGLTISLVCEFGVFWRLDRDEAICTILIKSSASE